MQTKDISIRQLRKNEVGTVVDLHIRNLKEGILYSLGEEITKKFYDHAIKDDTCLCLAAELDSKIVGFSVCTINKKRLLRRFYQKNFIKISFYLLLRTVTKPHDIISLTKLLKTDHTSNAYLLFLVVDQGYQGCGIGSLLFRHSTEYFRRNGVDCFYLDISDDNPGNNFYLKKGLVRVAQVSSANKRLNIYRCVLQ